MANGTDAHPATSRAIWVLFGLAVVALVGEILLAGSLDGQNQASVVGASWLISAAALAVGGVIGFLFGVPRSKPTEGGSGSVSANTNLEQVSDWLTKILIGVGLVQLAQIPGEFGRLASFLAPALGGKSASGPIAVLIAIYYLSLGFGIGFLQARVVLMREFGSDVLIDETGKQLDEMDQRIANLEQDTAEIGEKVLGISDRLQKALDLMKALASRVK